MSDFRRIFDEVKRQIATSSGDGMDDDTVADAIDSHEMTVDMLTKLPAHVRDTASRRKGIGIADDQLRPITLDEIIGQEHIKRVLYVVLSSAKRRGTPIDHTLLTGGPGLGKTTFAISIASELNYGVIMETGPALTKDRLVSVITQIINSAQTGRPLVIFVDEIHGLPAEAQDILLPLLEDFTWGGFTLPRFTFVAATTDPSKLKGPFRDRFPLKFDLHYYSDEEMSRIVTRSLGILWKIGKERAEALITEPDSAQAMHSLVRRSLGVPRYANDYLKLVRDFAIGYVPEEIVLNDDDELWEYTIPFTHEIVTDAMHAQGIDVHGLTASDRRILVTMFKRFQRPVGVRAIAAACGESARNIEEVIEPKLVRLGFIDRDMRGRTLTTAGKIVAACEIDGLTEF